MELWGLDMIKAYREHPEQFLPMIDLKGQIPAVQEYEDYTEHNIGWNAGILEGNRPFLATCWAADQITILTIYVSAEGIENYTVKELDQLFLKIGYYSYRNEENMSNSMDTFSDRERNKFFILTITVGIDDDPALIDGAPLESYKVLNEFNLEWEAKENA